MSGHQTRAPVVCPQCKQRGGLVDEITQLQARVETLRAELLKIDRVLKAAGLMEKARGRSRLIVDGVDDLDLGSLRLRLRRVPRAARTSELIRREWQYRTARR